MNYNNRKKTISTLLSIAVLLSAIYGSLKEEKYILPEKLQIEQQDKENELCKKKKIRS
jgi:hypothetical protein